MIACPSCGRDNVGVADSSPRRSRSGSRDYPQHFEVAVLGCAVNGPGEAGDADFGIAGGRDVGFVYAHGRVLKKVVVRDPRSTSSSARSTVDRRRDAAARSA